MPPVGSAKRKRSDRTYSQDDLSRPSPHRPGNLDLAKQTQPTSPTGQVSRENGARSNGQTTHGGGRRNESTQNPTAVSEMTTAKSVTPIPIEAAVTDVDVEMNLDSTNQDDRSAENRLYTYTYLTDEIVSTWTEGGKEVFLNEILQALKGVEDLTLDIMMQEAVEASTTGKILARDVGELLKDVFATEDQDMSELPTHGQSAFLGAVSTLFTEDTVNSNFDGLAELLIASNIDPSILRLELDGKLLEQLGLIRSTFYRVGIRKQTNVLYRQANFNLMREESEGFAKLMTELFSTSGNEIPKAEVVESTVEKVKAMIGAFDLDVGRSLDVVLDVFGSVLVRQYRFFVKLLRASPWWPSQEGIEDDVEDFTIVGGLPEWAQPGSQGWQLTEEQREKFQQLVHTRDSGFWLRAQTEGLRAFFRLGHMPASSKLKNEAASSEDDDMRNQWIRETGTIPPSGNRDAAQLLGFKLRFYAPSSARDPSEDLPKNLIYLSALLIKIGFISLHDLYPHIWRSDQEMDELKQQKTKDKIDRERAARPGAGARNALLMAGALADDTLPVPNRLRDTTTTRSSTPAKDVEEKSVTKDSTTDNADQKVLLLQSLLAIGALPEALFILGRFPWIVDLVPETPTYINRILHHCLSGIYDQLRPLQSRESLETRKPQYETDLPGLQPGQAKMQETTPPKVLRWPQLDKEDFEPDGVSYRYYWDEWNDNVPICQSIDDIFTLTKTLLPLVGAKIGQDPSLVLKLARIGKFSLDNNTSNQNKARWLDLSKRILLPSLSLTKANPGAVNEVFELINRFPTSSRYLMYLEWLNGRVSRSSDMKVAFDQAKAETRDILKRISKTNVRPMARALARIAYANPHIVITTALTQIEVYDSIADVFVEGARYFTDLGYDVLTWALISSMARAGRSRVQEGGIFTSKWLTALAHFAGKIYKRYNLMKPGPVLQYVSEQLDKGSSTDLIMLEQIVVSMAGIAPDTNFNDAQLQAMGGGSLLQSQTILQLLDQRHTSKGSSKRLVKALQDHGLTAKLLISMSQLRENCVFEDADVPLKAIGNEFDEINRVLGQYLDLLRANLSAEEFEKLIPDVATMLINYGIPPETAFWIGRPVIARQIIEFDKEHSEAMKESIKVNGDIDMTDPDSSEEDGEADETEELATSGATPTENELLGDVESGDIDTEVVVEENWHPILKSLMDNISNHLPSEVINTIGVGFFVTFWQLSLYEINVPSKSYEDEMSRQKRKIASITADRSNVSVSGSKMKEAQIKQLQTIIDDLLAENKQHLKAYGESRARLQKEKDQWFATKARMSTELNIALMEHCFLPRILSSPLDAYFCFKFAKFLHSTGTANFRTLGFYDQFFKPERLAALIFMCTSKESDNLGRFLNEVLKDLGRWHQSKVVYEREAFGSKKNLPGFALKVENGKPQHVLDFESFRRILFKWHSNLYSALIKCLTSTEYMHIRNAISILRSVSGTWPAVDFHGKALQKSVDKLRESDKEDLKVASQALLGALHRREKQWVVPQAFRLGQDGISQAKTPQPSTEKEKETATEEGEEGETKIETIPVKVEEVKPSAVEMPEQRNQGSARNTPVPSRDEITSERRPRPVESKPPHLPRKLSPPRHQASTNLPSRPEMDSRNGYRAPIRSNAGESPRPDSRITRHGLTERSHEPPYDHRYPRPERPSMLDRDDRPPRRDYEQRSNHDDRRHPERDVRHDHRVLDRDYQRPPERDYIRGPEYSRKIESTPLDRRTDPTSRVPVNNVPLPTERLVEESRPGMSIRGQAQDKGRSSRTSSPKRDERSIRPEREERPTNRSTGPTASPAGPRSTRESRPPNRGQVDMQHGRLEQEPKSRNEREEPPSGPRTRTGPRQSSSNVRPPSQDKPIPSGPGRQSFPEPVQPDTTGVHPDRMMQISPTEARNQRPPPLQTAPPAGPRAGNPPPSAPSGPSPNTRGPQIPPSGPSPSTRGPPSSAQAPSGPSPTTRGPPSSSQAPPSGPSPSTRGPPSGPQAEAGRGRRHQMTAVNNTLAQAAQGPGRGRGTMRQPSFPNTPDVTANPNSMPVQPRQQPRVEDDRRGQRNRPEEGQMPRSDREVKDDRRSGRRDEGTRGEGRGYRAGPTDDGSTNRRPREEHGSNRGSSRRRGG